MVDKALMDSKRIGRVDGALLRALTDAGGGRYVELLVAAVVGAALGAPLRLEAQ
jgi:hypothetical protein